MRATSEEVAELDAKVNLPHRYKGGQDLAHLSPTFDILHYGRADLYWERITQLMAEGAVRMKFSRMNHWGFVASCWRKVC